MTSYANQLLYGSYMHGSANFSPFPPEHNHPPPHGQMQSIERLRTELSYADRSHVSGRRNPTRHNHAPPSFAPLDHDLLRAADRAAAAVPKPSSRFPQAELQSSMSSAAPVMITSASMPALVPMDHREKRPSPPPPPAHAHQTEAITRAAEKAATEERDRYPHPSWGTPPWLKEEPIPQRVPRRPTTRERTWRENIAAAREGRGPDPLAVHVLRKHGRRFVPGGLASRTYPHLEGVGTLSNSTFAVSNVRLCTVSNGYACVRDARPVIPRY
jgi:hypothetical protein